jgi:hypothetical protein
MKMVLLSVLLIPLLLVPLAVAGVLVMACDMHVGAIDGMKDKGVSVARRGMLYSFCNYMNGVERPIL